MTGVASGAANAYTSVAPFFSEIRVTQSLVFVYCFVYYLLSSIFW